MGRKIVGRCDYPGRGTITDEQVWQWVKNHSRLIDRISRRKMVEMTIAAQLILFGIYENEGWYADQKDWTFYGKGGFFTRIHEEGKKSEYIREVRSP